MKISSPLQSWGTFGNLAMGYWKDTADIVNNWALDREFKPKFNTHQREQLIRGWKRAVERSLAWDVPEQSAAE